MDRLLMSFLRMTIIGLITLTAGAAVMLSYRGIFTLLAHEYPTCSAASVGRWAGSGHRLLLPGS